MKIIKVDDYHKMSSLACQMIFDEVMLSLRQGKKFNLGLATGNTMIELYKLLAEKFNAAKADLALLHTWNLDEYAMDMEKIVPHEHKLSYWKYMHENLFSFFDPSLGFQEEHAHFPHPAKGAEFDKALETAGGLDLQLLGIGFNGHIAFNEPEDPEKIRVEEYGSLPTRVLALTRETIDQNTLVTADGDSSLVPRYAATMGMKTILQAKKELLLACFAQQEEPLKKMLAGKKATPALPASYLLDHKDFTLIYTADLINLDDVI